MESYTFGSPRSGNKAWANKYDRTVPDTFRFHNHNDAVAQTPWFMGYSHVRCQSRLDSYIDDKGEEVGLLYMPEENPISVFGRGTISPEVSATRLSFAHPRPDRAALDTHLIRSSANTSARIML